MIRHQLLPLFKSCIHTSNNSKFHYNLNGLMTTTELSPAAQAIFDAWEDEWNKASLCHDQHSIAAVLRAAADQLDHPTSAHTLYAFADELEGKT